MLGEYRLYKALSWLSMVGALLFGFAACQTAYLVGLEPTTLILVLLAVACIIVMDIASRKRDAIEESGR